MPTQYVDLFQIVCVCVLKRTYRNSELVFFVAKESDCGNAFELDNRGDFGVLGSRCH